MSDINQLYPLFCGFKAFGMMPPCRLEPGHEGDHADSFGGFYSQVPEGLELVQDDGSKELRYTESRADYFSIDCDDPMFEVPQFVEDALLQPDHTETCEHGTPYTLDCAFCSKVSRDIATKGFTKEDAVFMEHQHYQSPVNAFTFYGRLQDNFAAWSTERITLDEFTKTQTAIWAEAEAAGQRETLLTLWRKANPVAQQPLFESKATLI